jgi:HPt (histidine-containing phosphotransfer) domain-containing protein
VLSTFDRDDFLKRLEGDEELFVAVIRLFLQDCPGQLEAIEAALDARSAEDIRISAHALKGSAATLSAFRLAKAAETMERLGAERQLDEAAAVWTLVSAEASLVTELLRRQVAPGAD